MTDQPNPDGRPPKPYLRIGQATLFVTDQDRSLKFYIEKLGLTLVADLVTSSGIRWVAVAFPDGSTILELIAPMADSKEYGLIGQMNRLMLITEDVAEVYRQWSEQGVYFMGRRKRGTGVVSRLRLTIRTETSSHLLRSIE